MNFDIKIQVRNTKQMGIIINYRSITFNIVSLIKVNRNNFKVVITIIKAKIIIITNEETIIPILVIIDIFIDLEIELHFIV